MDQIQMDFIYLWYQVPYYHYYIHYYFTVLTLDTNIGNPSLIPNWSATEKTMDNDNISKNTRIFDQH